MSDSVRPHRRQPTRLPCPWDSPGKSTGVGCHFLLQAWKWKVKVKSLSRVQVLETPWTAALSRSTAANDIISFFFHSWVTSHTHTHTHTHTHHLGCFHVLVIVNMLLWTPGCMYLLELYFSLDICPEVRLHNCMITLFYPFLKMDKIYERWFWELGQQKHRTVTSNGLQTEKVNPTTPRRENPGGAQSLPGWRRGAEIDCTPPCHLKRAWHRVYWMQNRSFSWWQMVTRYYVVKTVKTMVRS